MIWLTATGARTSLAREVPLVAVVVGDQLAVIGSDWGRAGRLTGQPVQSRRTRGIPLLPWSPCLTARTWWTVRLP
jgi:hypothetical protein